MSKTYDEMKAQYGALKETLIYVKNRINIINRFINEKSCGTVAFIGSGSSYSVSKSLETIYRNLSGKPAMSAAAGDIFLHAERYKKPLENAVVIAVSRSGSTSELLEAVRAIKEITEARFIALTCVENAPIKEIADVTLEMPWAFDESVCQTRTVSNLYVAGAVVAAGMADRADITEELEATIGSLEAFSERIEPVFLQLAKERFDSVAVLADAEIAGLAEEGALAFKEISQVASNQYGLLDCRHGPMVMIGKSTLVIASLSDGGEQELRLIADVAKKNAIIVTCTDEPLKLPKVYLNIAFGKKLDNIGRGLALLIVCQYTAYYKALVKGLNPDSPAGLDAWIKL